MRTNIDVDEALLAQAMEVCGATTKRAAVEAALRLAVQLKAQEGILKWRGKIHWEGDLSVSREGRYMDWDLQRVGAKLENAETSETVPVRAGS
jgi:Arc/MetJ family transcription regulator